MNFVHARLIRTPSLDPTQHRHLKAVVNRLKASQRKVRARESEMAGCHIAGDIFPVERCFRSKQLADKLEDYFV